MNQTRPGRNDPCPCGSGRKFKRCCADGGAAPGPAEAGRQALAAGMHELAIAQLRRAVQLDPADHAVHANLAVALEARGLLHEALASHQEALRLGRHGAAAAGLLLNYQLTLKNCQARLFGMTRSGALDAPALFDEHRRFGELFERPGRPGRRDFANAPEPERRLRIGYVSPDFRRHSIAYFFEPIVSHHDRGQVEVFCYYSCPIRDEVTRHLAARADHWVECLELSDAALAARIESDGIDILVDLAGHTTGSRLLSLVHRPAPIQMGYLGYPATSGMRCVDYRLGDAVADPPGLADACFTERPLRLEQAMLVYRPGHGAGGFLAEEEPPLAGPAAGPVRFGSFNDLSKLNAGVFDAWAAILQALPDVTLTLKSRALDEAAAQRGVAAELQRRGVPAPRLRLLGRDEEPLAHLRRYAEIDIALDPFPYNGVTTSFEALWMGVPLITLAGATPAARMGATIATHLGHAEWIADTPAQYIGRAVALAADRERLGQLRRTLRGELKASCLMDGPGFARRLEAAYRKAWRDWCADRLHGAATAP